MPTSTRSTGRKAKNQCKRYSWVPLPSDPLPSPSPTQRARGTEQAKTSAFRDTSFGLVYLQRPQSSTTPPRSGPLPSRPSLSLKRKV